nr:hypothetical protein [Orientia tsutsugamushi]
MTCNCSQPHQLDGTSPPGYILLFIGCTVALVIMAMIAYYYKNKAAELEKKTNPTPESLNITTHASSCCENEEVIVSSCQVEPSQCDLPEHPLVSSSVHHENPDYFPNDVTNVRAFVQVGGNDSDSTSSFTGAGNTVLLEEPCNIDMKTLAGSMMYDLE